MQNVRTLYPVTACPTLLLGHYGHDWEGSGIRVYTCAECQAMLRFAVLALHLRMLLVLRRAS